MATVNKDFKVKHGLNVAEGGTFGSAVVVGTPTENTHAATKLYVDQMQRKGYAYMTQADYFIKKDDGSKLAAMCEDFNVKTSHILSVGEKRLWKTTKE